MFFYFENIDFIRIFYLKIKMNLLKISDKKRWVWSVSKGGFLMGLSLKKWGRNFVRRCLTPQRIWGQKSLMLFKKIKEEN